MDLDSVIMVHNVLLFNVYELTKRIKTLFRCKGTTFFAYLQEKSASLVKNLHVFSRKPKGCAKGQFTKYKGQDNSQKSKVESEESRAGDGESGESNSPEKEERRESGLNPDEMNITLRGGNGLWMRMFIDH